MKEVVIDLSCLEREMTIIVADKDEERAREVAERAYVDWATAGDREDDYAWFSCCDEYIDEQLTNAGINHLWVLKDESEE